MDEWISVVEFSFSFLDVSVMDRVKQAKLVAEAEDHQSIGLPFQVTHTKLVKPEDFLPKKNSNMNPLELEHQSKQTVTPKSNTQKLNVASPNTTSSKAASSKASGRPLPPLPSVSQTETSKPPLVVKQSNATGASPHSREQVVQGLVQATAATSPRPTSDNPIPPSPADRSAWTSEHTSKAKQANHLTPPPRPTRPSSKP